MLIYPIAGLYKIYNMSRVFTIITGLKNKVAFNYQLVIPFLFRQVIIADLPV